MDQIRESLLKTSIATKRERFGRSITMAALILIAVIVVSIFYFIASKGLSTFFVDKINVWEFLSGKTWNPGTTDAHGKQEVSLANDCRIIFNYGPFSHYCDTICNWYGGIHDRNFTKARCPNFTTSY